MVEASRKAAAKLEKEKKGAVAEALLLASQQEEHDEGLRGKACERAQKAALRRRKLIISQEEVGDFSVIGPLGQVAMHHFKAHGSREAARWQVCKQAAEEGASRQRQPAQAVIGKQREGARGKSDPS